LPYRLIKKYKTGFSTTNLWNFREIYLTFEDRIEILHPAGGELQELKKNLHPGEEFRSEEGTVNESRELISEFNPQLTWSHYRKWILHELIGIKEVCTEYSTKAFTTNRKPSGLCFKP